MTKTNMDLKEIFEKAMTPGAADSPTSSGSVVRAMLYAIHEGVRGEAPEMGDGESLTEFAAPHAREKGFKVLASALSLLAVQMGMPAKVMLMNTLHAYNKVEEEKERIMNAEV